MATVQQHQNKANEPDASLGSLLIQPKLKIGQPGDKYEREADRVADAVMRMPASPVQMQSLEEEEEEKLQMQPLEEEEELQMMPETPQTQQMCPRCRERALQGKPLNCPDCEKKLQMMPAVQQQSEGQSYTSSEVSSQLQTSKGQGSSLAPGVHQEMGSKMGADFSGVRVHTGSKSHQLNNQLGARAFTYGNDIYFSKGAYNPNSSSGKRLLAHELTHVVQQSAAPRGTKIISRDPDPSESLPTEERKELIRLTGNRISRSASYYNDALLEVKIKVGNMLKEQKAAADAMFELAFGLLMPGVGKLLGKGLANVAATLPPTASTASYRTAIALLDENRTKELFVKATDVGLKVSKIDINDKLKSITGDPEYEVFFTALEKSAAAGFDKLDASLSSKSDKELGVLYMSYDPTEISSSDYVRVIEDLFLKFKEQVHPIGKKTEGRYGSMKARWIEGAKWRALALTGEGRYFNVGAGPKFITWISSDMKEPAIEATKAINWGRIDIVHYGKVEVSGSTTTAGMKFLLDSNFPYGGGDKVLEPSSGTTRMPSKQVCPSCHGETGGTRSPGTEFSDFEFQERGSIFPPPEPKSLSESDVQAIREWLEAVPRE